MMQQSRNHNRYYAGRAFTPKGRPHAMSSPKSYPDNYNKKHD